MTSSARLGAKSGPVLTLTLLESGAIGRAWMGELTSCTVEPDAGTTTIVSPYTGEDATPWFIKGEAVQSTAVDSLWRFTWDHTGERVGYSLAPHGNAEATPDEPILRGELVVGPRPQLGGAATDRTFTFAFDWALTAEPILDEGAA